MKVERIGKRPEGDIRILVILKEKTPRKTKVTTIKQQEKNEPLGLEFDKPPALETTTTTTTTPSTIPTHITRHFCTWKKPRKDCFHRTAPTPKHSPKNQNQERNHLQNPGLGIINIRMG